MGRRAIIGLLLITGCGRPAPAPPTVTLTNPGDAGHRAEPSGPAAYREPSLAVVNDQVCLARAGRVSCWSGQRQPNERNVALPSPARMLSAGGDRICALLHDGTVSCWEHEDAPARVDGLPFGVRSISVGYGAACALVDERVFCWGALSDSSPPTTPQHIDLGLRADGIALQESTTADLAVSPADGGLTSFFFLPCVKSFDCSERTEPPRNEALGPKLLHVAIRALYGCAIDASGAVDCWDGPSPQSPSAVQHASFGGHRAIQLAVLNGGACALLDDGGVRCFGSLPKGVSDRPCCDRVPANAPVAPPLGGKTVRAIAAGHYSLCIAWNEGGLTCWGHDVVRGSVP